MKALDTLSHFAAVSDFLSDHLTLIFVTLIGALAVLRYQKRHEQQKAAKTYLTNITADNNEEPPSLHPEIDPTKCAGCGACTKVCPEGDILKMVNHKAVLVSPSKCVGHGECERACPFGAISLVFGTKTRGMDMPRLSGNYETNVPGLYIAGELGGMGLIRNAVKQGTLAATHALDSLELDRRAKARGKKADVDLLVVGAGPAGLAAGLVAISEQKSYVVIDQNTFGGTISNFPRQKLVMSQPAKLPIVGDMRFEENRVSKEKLLRYWERIRKKTGLDVREKVRFENLKKEEDVFYVTTSKGVLRARKVILAMGVRGTPRRLNLPNEDLPKVTYNLLEPGQYKNKNIAVVGGGNAGVEAAQMLAKKEFGNKVTLLVRSQTFDRCNQKNQDIIFAMQKQGLVDIQFNAAVTKIEPETITFEKDGATKALPNDFLFIFAGAEMPFQFLMSLGIEIDKKFGEALSKAK